MGAVARCAPPPRCGSRTSRRCEVLGAGRMALERGAKPASVRRLLRAGTDQRKVRMRCSWADGTPPDSGEDDGGRSPVPG